MSEKIELKEKLAAVDMGARDMWDELDQDQQKALKSEFFILNRYVSSAKSSSRDMQEHFVLTTNEYFNKHWNLLQKHPKLMWQLLAMCGHESKKIMFHEWIGFKKKKGDSKKVKVLLDIYPNRKQDELEMLAQLMTKKDFKELLEQNSYTDKEIAKIVG